MGTRGSGEVESVGKLVPVALTHNEEVGQQALGRDHKGRAPGLREQWQEQEKEV